MKKLFALLIPLALFACDSPFIKVSESTETARFDHSVDYFYHVKNKQTGGEVVFRGSLGNDHDPNWVYISFLRTFLLKDALKELEKIAIWIEDGRVNPGVPINYYIEDGWHYDKLCISKKYYTVWDERDTGYTPIGG